MAYEVGSGVSVEDLSNWILNQTYAGKPMKHADNGSRKMQLFELAQRFWSEMEATNWRIEKEPVGDPIAVFATRCYSQGLLRRTG